MRPKNVYLLLCVAGFVIPYIPFVRWVVDHGLDFRLFVGELFSNGISTFFGMDVLVSALAVVVFWRTERHRLTLRWPWLPIVVLLCVGVSLALPLTLYLRETAPETKPALAND